MQLYGQEEKRQAVRVSTVDNFQGEEARIILASLVRSNTAGKIGFLYEPERVNVLLSRARDALILVGNPHCLCGRKGNLSDTETDIVLAPTKPMAPPVHLTTKTLTYPPAPKKNSDSKSTWETVLEHVKPVTGFPARCQQHGHEVLLRMPQDFEQYTPDGGCMQRCGARLPCGHTCTSRCHAQRVKHAACREMVDCMCALFVLLFLKPTLRSSEILILLSLRAMQCTKPCLDADSFSGIIHLAILLTLLIFVL